MACKSEGVRYRAPSRMTVSASGSEVHRGSVRTSWIGGIPRVNHTKIEKQCK